MKRSENEKQKAKKEVLQTELLKQRNITNPLPDDGVNNERYSFTRVEGVTVCFGPNGGIILPSVRLGERPYKLQCTQMTNLRRTVRVLTTAGMTAESLG